MTAEDYYLKQIKFISIALKIIKPGTILDRKSWLQFKEDGYSPLDAVKEDMSTQLCKLFRL